MADVELHAMKQMNAYIGVRGNPNMSEFAQIPHEKMKIYQDHLLTPVHFKCRVPKTKWVILRWPTPSMAQEARMSTHAFEKFYFSVCLADYERMAARRRAAVRAHGHAPTGCGSSRPGPISSFSIKGIPRDPVRREAEHSGRRVLHGARSATSVNGRVQFNTRTIYNGVQLSDIDARVPGGAGRARDGVRHARR